MSVKHQVQCDKCGSPIAADRTRISIECGPLRGVVATDSGESVVDLCRSCAEAFLSWLRPAAPGPIERGLP